MMTKKRSITIPINIATIIASISSYCVQYGNATICPVISNSDESSSCPEGCWHDDTDNANAIEMTTYSDPSPPRECQPVGFGYYSPRNDDLRYPCGRGSFSNIQTAESCTSCPAGTYASREGRNACQVCPPSTYSGMPRSTGCSLCDPTYYNGVGANSIQVWNGIAYCVLSTPPPTDEPTTHHPPAAQSPSSVDSTSSPTSGPSLSPSSLPSNAPTTQILTTRTPTQEPSEIPTTSPPEIPTTSFAPTADNLYEAKTESGSNDGDEDGETFPPTTNTTNTTTTNPTETDDDDLGNSTLVDTFPTFLGLSCDDDEYVWHGGCRQCSSQLFALLHPLWMLLFLAIVIFTLGYLQSCHCCIDIFWLGLEYLQYLYLLSLVPLTSLTPILQETYDVISIFALDLDSGLSLQCMMENFNISPTGEQVFVLLVPVIVWMLLCATSKLLSKDGIPVLRWMTVGLYLGYAKLFMTSVEALRCSSSSSSSQDPSTWFCHDELFGSILGSFGLLGYGIGFPLWFLWNLRQSAFSNDDSPKAWMRKVFPFQTTCWWWTGFWMARKAVLAVLIVFFYDHSPTIILTALLVALMLSEVLQRIQSRSTGTTTPSTDDDDAEQGTSKFNQCEDSTDDGQDYAHPRWFQTGNVDLTFQSCLSLLTASTFLCFALSAEQSLALGILFLIVFVPSIIYWILALCHCQIKKSIRSTEDTNTDSNEEYGHTKTAPKVGLKISMGNEDFMEPATDSSNDQVEGSEQTTEDVFPALPLSANLGENDRIQDSTQVPEKEPKNAVKWQSKKAEGNGKDRHPLDYVSEEDSDSGVIFHDSDETSISSNDDDGGSGEGAVDVAGNDNCTLVEEIWIDEATGLPVDPRSGQWTDAETGFRAAYCNTNNDDDDDTNDDDDDVVEDIPPSRLGGRGQQIFRKKQEWADKMGLAVTTTNEEEVPKIDINNNDDDFEVDDDDGDDNHDYDHRQILKTRTGDSGDTLVLERHDAEPFTWGQKIQSPVYKPPPKF